MLYRLPENDDKAVLAAYVQEHIDNGETDITASQELATSDYDEWVKKIQNNALVGDPTWGRSLLYFCFKSGRLVGLLSIRPNLSDRLAHIYGHIGYGVRPSERKKGYATVMLRHALILCKERSMSEVILGCYKDNQASGATIRKCGGVLFAENDGYTKGRISQYYAISL